MSRNIKPKNILAEIDWITIIPARYDACLPDKIYVSYGPRTNKPGAQIAKVHIRIGNKVSEKLGWKHGMKFAVAYHPDDLFNFRVIPCQKNEPGYTFTRETTAQFHYIRFNWPHKRHPLKKQKGMEVSFTTPRNAYLQLDAGEHQRSQEDNSDSE